MEGTDGVDKVHTIGLLAEVVQYSRGNKSHEKLKIRSWHRHHIRRIGRSDMIRRVRVGVRNRARITVRNREDWR